MLVSFCAACFSIVDYFWAVRKPYMNMEIKELKRRNRWISVIATILTKKYKSKRTSFIM